MREIISKVYQAVMMFFTHKDKSFGVVPVFEKGTKRLYLLTTGKRQYWNFPKGHALLFESPKDAARRELAEETGLTGCDLIENFVSTERYSFRYLGWKIYKTTQLFIGRVQSMEVESDKQETIEYKWLDFSQAMETLTYDSGKKVLREADRYLNG